MEIPKIIHQIWIGNKPIPTKYIDTFRKDYIEKFPHYDYILWDENKINNLPMSQVIKNIYNKEPTMYGKADIARLVILYEYGGIYIDADCVWINNKCFDDLIEKSINTGLFAALTPGRNYLTNSVIGSIKNNPELDYLINSELPKKYQRRHKFPPSKITGPMLLNILVEQDRNITVFPSVYFYPIRWHGIKDSNLHKKLDLPKESYMFQYGISTNNLKYW